MNEKFAALLTKEKKLRIKSTMLTLSFFRLYTVHIKNYDNSFFILTTRLNKATSVLLKSMNI